MGKLPGPLRPYVRRAKEVSSELGLPAFLVGGFVRDLILGRKNFDLDIAVEGPAIRFAERFHKVPGWQDCRIVTHARFGTATVECRGLKIDFATTRKERYPVPAALPVVTPSTLKDDLFRRDFTINTLAVGLSGKEYGRLIDLFRGREDLARGIIRVLHDASFIDDPTRILRAARFEQRFGFRIEPRTLRLIREAVKRGMLERVQPQRLRDELLLMLNERYPGKALDRLQSLTGLVFFRPAIRPRRWNVLFSRIRRDCARLPQRCPCPPAPTVVFLAALFSDLDPAQARRVCDAFGIGRHSRDAVLAYAASGKTVGERLSDRRLSRPELFRLLEPLPPETVVLVAALTRKKTVRRRIGEFFASCRGARVCLSGDDLKRMGIPPGPEYGRILRSLLDARLSGKVATKEQELALVGRLRKGNAPVMTERVPR